MSHVGSGVLIKGGNYGGEPEPGNTSVEVYYVPSLGLSHDEVARNFKKIRKLIDKIYHIEEQPEE